MDRLTEERLAHNQTVFRDANEQIAAAADRIGAPTRRLPFICECSDAACTQILLVEPVAYSAVRTNPRWFLHAPEHEADLGSVVERYANYVVVEKDGAAATVAEERAR